MTNIKHIYGRWSFTWAKTKGDYSYMSIMNGKEVTIAEIPLYERNGLPIEQCKANAKLIAAAPELLQVLEDIAKMDNKDFANSFHSKGETAKQIMFIGQLAKAALKKVTE